MRIEHYSATAESAPYSHPDTLGSISEIQATAPGNYRVIRRNGKVTGFDRNKIKIAMTKAFLANEGNQAAASSRIHESVEQLTEQVLYALTRSRPDGGTCLLYTSDAADG